MNKQQEKVLVAALCGLVITAAGAFAVQPAMAAGYQVDQLAQVTGVAQWDNLNVRKWPCLGGTLHRGKDRRRLVPGR
jgi:hypothetical protein